MSAATKTFHQPLLEVIASPSASLVAPPGLDRVELAMAELSRLGGGGRATKMTEQHLASGGKRLRARLALAAAAAMGGAEQDAVMWAAAVELLHNATLVHDDIQDGDDTRRGVPTVWSIHGKEQALNAGDFMLMLPYIAVSRINGPVSSELSRAIAEHAVRTVCGQVDEIDLLPRNKFDWSSYSQAVLGKTGALLSLPVYGAAILSGRSLGQARRLGDAFCKLGLMFQLQDDVLDLYGNKGRDRVGSDLYEGKVSALVVAHLERRPEDQAWLVNLLQTPRYATRVVDVVNAIDAFAQSGALGDILDRIDAIGRDTCENSALSEVPALREIGRHLVELASRPICHLNKSHRSTPTHLGVSP